MCEELASRVLIAIRMMKRLRLVVSLPALLFASTAIAAPPGASEPPPPPPPVPQQPQPELVAAAEPAPQNEAWNNVSHINGQLVPVGERGNYLYKWKTTNISSNPLGWLVGFYGLSLSYAVSDHVVVRGDGNIIRPIETDAHGYELGATAPIYFKRVYQGPFIEPGVLVRDLDTTDEQRRFTGAQVNFGWHWTFDSGLNVSAAIGAARRLGKTESNIDGDVESPIEPTGYFRVGYAY
jgi:hypothetical protein